MASQVTLKQQFAHSGNRSCHKQKTIPLWHVTLPPWRALRPLRRETVYARREPSPSWRARLPLSAQARHTCPHRFPPEREGLTSRDASFQPPMRQTKTASKVSSRNPARGRGRGLWFFFLRLLDFFFLTSVSFGHIDFLVVVQRQLGLFDRVLQEKTRVGSRQTSVAQGAIPNITPAGTAPNVPLLSRFNAPDRCNFRSR